MNLFPMLLDAQENVPPASDYSNYQGLVLILVGFVFLYFILWRPEQKRRKTLETQRASLKEGDEVVAVGILGTVDEIKDNTIVLTMVDGSKIEVLKAAVSDKVENSTSK